MNSKLLLGLGAAAAAVAVFVYLQSAGPSGPQDQATAPGESAVVADDDFLVNVNIPAEFSADAQIGKRGFEAKCAVCHGLNAAGQNGIAPPLVHPTYRPGHHPDSSFVAAARRGVRSHHWDFGDMVPVQGLTDADVKYIARYIRELQRENGIN